MSSERIELDLGNIASHGELHDLLGSRLGFPDYYGRNWNAFWDCIRDPEQSLMPAVLEVRGWAALQERMSHDAQSLRSCLQDLSGERPECRVVWD